MLTSEMSWQTIWYAFTNVLYVYLTMDGCFYVSNLLPGFLKLHANFRSLCSKALQEVVN